MSNEGYLNQPYALMKLRSLNEMLTRSKERGWKERIGGIGAGIGGGASPIIPGIYAINNPPTKVSGDFTETVPFNLESLAAPIMFTGAGLLAGYNVAHAKSGWAKAGYLLTHFGLEALAFFLPVLQIPKTAANTALGIEETYLVTSYLTQIGLAGTDLLIQGAGFVKNKNNKQNYEKEIESTYQSCLKNLLSRPTPDWGGNRYAASFLDCLGETISIRFNTDEKMALESKIYETWKGADDERKTDVDNIEENVINIIKDIDNEQTTLTSYLTAINTALINLEADVINVYNENSFLIDIDTIKKYYKEIDNIISEDENYIDIPPVRVLNEESVEKVSRYCYKINTSMSLIQRVINLDDDSDLQKKGKEAYDNIVAGKYEFFGLTRKNKPKGIHKKIIKDFQKYGSMNKTAAKNLLERVLKYKTRTLW